ncbi:hypothetical protein [Virgisporangium ochraceum]|uniref:Uncharacterized protein n=1 Tax=Virgisporangium ochraceum TaxID=65505 RepID=A0A8J3ZPH2_9ACTN|nr:hypothetical protein [Virgisporangium ochraceum]GIJ66603.1 hypothetical protein Voc01_015200 [Virgisporangium ochraceum]
MSQQPPPWPEPWAVHASVEADRIGHRLDAAAPEPSSSADRAARAAVEYHLDRAREASRCTRRPKRRSWRDKWRGTSVEAAFMHLHAAKVFLVDLLPAAEVEALLPDVTARVAATLDRNDPRRVEAEALLRTARGQARRAVVKQLMETSYDAADEEYVRLRDFRNIILVTAAAIAVFTAVLVGTVFLWPDAIPFCFEPGVTTAATDLRPVQQVHTVCPSGGGQRPSSGDILIIAGLGAVGGVLGALVAVRRLRGSSTPYCVAKSLAVLKVPSGALSAVIGMLLLSGGFVPGLSELDNQPQILAYALLFGIAQHLVTRAADDRAQQLLNHLPSKDPRSETAQPSVTPLATTDRAERVRWRRRGWKLVG